MKNKQHYFNIQRSKEKLRGKLENTLKTKYFLKIKAQQTKDYVIKLKH